MQHRIRPA